MLASLCAELVSVSGGGGRLGDSDGFVRDVIATCRSTRVLYPQQPCSPATSFDEIALLSEGHVE